MSPSHARKAGVKYRYYLSSAILNGVPEGAGSIRRVPAIGIEALVVRAVRERLKLSEPVDDRNLVNTYVERIEVRSDQLVIAVVRTREPGRRRKHADNTLCVPWCKVPSKRHLEILLPAGTPPQHARPIRSETRALLVASIARGRQWLDELLTDPNASAESIAKRARCSLRQVNMTVSLAFLAPDLVGAAIAGRLPRSIGVTRLRDAPAEWSRQHAMLGLPS
jgi:site-specific DNA recombinase